MHWVTGPGNMPVRPVSSSMVKRHSKGGSLAEVGMSSKARAAATPMPLSAPSVVPSACSWGKQKGCSLKEFKCRMWPKSKFQHGTYNCTGVVNMAWDGTVDGLRKRCLTH